MGFLKFLILSLFAVHVCNAEVTVLGADLVEKVAYTGGKWFIKFYAPWCGHCKAMADAWENLALQFGDGLHVAEIDCTVEAHQRICNGFNANSYPTLIYIEDGRMTEYNGGRTADKFYAWVSGITPKNLTHFMRAPRPMDAPPTAEDVGIAEKLKDVAPMTSQQAFDYMRTGSWVVEFTRDVFRYNPMHVQFGELATKLKAKGISAATIDAEVEREFMNRFVSAPLPFYAVVHDGVAWFPDSENITSAEDFEKFCVSGYKESGKPIPWPTSWTLKEYITDRIAYVGDWISFHAVPTVEIAIGVGLLLGFAIGRMTV